MASGIATAIRQVRAFLADADPGRVTSNRAAGLVHDFAELHRLAAAGMTIFAGRAADANVWIDQGHSSPASWLAEQTQGPMGEAIAAIETSRRLVDLPDTADALRGGSLSSAQVNEVARAADKDPSAEAELLELAGKESLKTLKHRSRQVMAQSSSREDEAARYRAIKERRYVRTFTDHMGAFCLDARLTPDAGARLAGALQAEADALFEEARKSGTRESADAYRADALVALTTGTARTQATSADDKGKTGSSYVVNIRVDAAALRRGHTISGETCEIVGLGPVPVATVRELLPEAFVKTFVHDGVDVLHVSHIGRTVSAHTQSALDFRDPTCVVPGCSVAHGLENHHWKQDFALSGTTSLAELARVCSRHHDLITYGGFLLLGGPGKWDFKPPPSGAKGPLFEDTG